MESFVVSARKYRPATFDTVIGQHSITNTLKNAIINNHLAQAFLFCGPRGVGKTTCARILAKTINCKNITENIEPCNECESCISFNKSASFNIHELDAASNNSVDDIRNLIDQVRVPPQVGKYKVYIIDEVHMLSMQAFNAFLKTLEEPPPYAKFILATTEKHKIIPTILSRCQVFDFKRISVDDILKYLIYVAEKEKVDAGEDALHIIAQKADGSLRDALSIFDQLVSFSGKKLEYDTVIDNLNVLDYDYYFRMTDLFLAGNVSDTLLLINEIIDNGFDGQHFLIGMGEHLRNLLVSRDESTVRLLEIAPYLKEKYFDQASRCPATFILKALDIINQCDINYKSSNNKHLHLELSLMQICNILNAPHIPEKKIPEKKEKTTGKAPAKDIAPGAKKQEEVKETSRQKADAGTAAGKRIPGTISIKKSAREKQEEKVAEKNNGPDQENRPSDKFTPEQLEKAWMLFVSRIEADSPNFFNTLTKRKPVLKDNFVIELKLDNKVQDKELQERKTELLDFLRQELNNYHIRLKTEIIEKQEKEKAYFPEEVYKKMVEKNPNIKKLKDQLDLEIDY